GADPRRRTWPSRRSPSRTTRRSKSAEARANPMQHDHFPRYQPKTRFGRWFDERLPATRLVYDSFVAYPVPRNLNYAYTFGGILSFMLVAQILTGVVLAMHYTPHTSMAFQSVENIMRDVNSGWLLRYLHSNGASMFFIAVYIH